jgi:hypothetical protein
VVTGRSTNDGSTVYATLTLIQHPQITGYTFAITATTKGVTVVNDTSSAITFRGMQIYCGNSMASVNPLQVVSNPSVSVPAKSTRFIEGENTVSGMSNATWAYATYNMDTPSGAQVRLSMPGMSIPFGSTNRVEVTHDVITPGTPGGVILRIW